MYSHVTLIQALDSMVGMDMAMVELPNFLLIVPININIILLIVVYVMVLSSTMLKKTVVIHTVYMEVYVKVQVLVTVLALCIVEINVRQVSRRK